MESPKQPWPDDNNKKTWHQTIVMPPAPAPWFVVYEGVLVIVLFSRNREKQNCPPLQHTVFVTYKGKGVNYMCIANGENLKHPWHFVFFVRF